MGPSWYWMPDVFDKFFNDFGKKVSDYFHYQTKSAYRVYFGKDDFIDIEDTPEKICKKFESIEKGSGEKLKKYLKIAKENYEIGVTDMLYKMPGNSRWSWFQKKQLNELDFSYPILEKMFVEILKILNYAPYWVPVLFLGAKASNTPAFYNFMNYADFGIGTFQPPNGFHDLVNAMVDLGKSLGSNIKSTMNFQKSILGKKSREYCDK